MWSGVCVYVCVSSVTLVHPAKVVGWNEMPLGRDTRVVSNNIVLDMGPSPQHPRPQHEWEIWGCNLRSDVAYGQITLLLVTKHCYIH